MHRTEMDQTLRMWVKTLNPSWSGPSPYHNCVVVVVVVVCCRCLVVWLVVVVGVCVRCGVCRDTLKNTTCAHSNVPTHVGVAIHTGRRARWRHSFFFPQHTQQHTATHNNRAQHNERQPTTNDKRKYTGTPETTPRRRTDGQQTHKERQRQTHDRRSEHIYKYIHIHKKIKNKSFLFELSVNRNIFQNK